jgi:hypothetical protein
MRSTGNEVLLKAPVLIKFAYMTRIKKNTSIMMRHSNYHGLEPSSNFTDQSKTCGAAKIRHKY